MIASPDLIQKLHNGGIIDKRFVLWWQIGFEGRRVFSEEEFESGLKTSKRKVFEIKGQAIVGEKEKDYQFWMRDDVPILIRNVEMFGEQIPCFTTVKPISHEGRYGQSILQRTDTQLPPEANLSPHIRGIAIDVTQDFLFWTPFLSSTQQMYQTSARTSQRYPFPILIAPIDASKFYRNTINKMWDKGKRLQKRAKEINLNLEESLVVPYWEFNPAEPQHFTIYPSKVFPQRYDLPVILRGQEKGIPQVIGAGYFIFGEYRFGGGNTDEVACYWDLSHFQEKCVRESLIKRLGRLTRK